MVPDHTLPSAMKKIKTQPLTVKLVDKEDGKVSTPKDPVTPKPATEVHTKRSLPKAKANFPSEGKPNKAPAKGSGRSVAEKVRNFDGAHSVKEKQRPQEPLLEISLPDELAMSCTTPPMADESDEVRSSIVGQILASVRGETGAASGATAAAIGADSRYGTKQRKPSPPPVAARPHHIKPNSASSEHHPAKIHSVRAKDSNGSLSDSSSQRDAFISSKTGVFKPIKSSPESNPNPCLPILNEHPPENAMPPGKESKGARGGTTTSKVKDNGNVSHSICSQAGLIQDDDSREERISTHKTDCAAESSSKTVLTKSEEHKPPNQTAHNPLSQTSNSSSLSTSMDNVAIVGNKNTNNPHHNDNELSDRNDYCSHTVIESAAEEDEIVGGESNKGKSVDSLEDSVRLDRPLSCQSRYVTAPSGQIISRDGGSNPPLPVKTAAAMTSSSSEFPQSLSADSGIGSPTSYSCAIGRDGERGGLRPTDIVASTDASLALSTSNNDTNQITPSPITSAPEEVEPNYLQVPKSSSGQRAIGEVAISSDNSSADQTREKIESDRLEGSKSAVSDKPSDEVSHPLGTTLLPPSTQTIERTTHTARDTDHVILEISSPPFSISNVSSSSSPNAFQTDEQSSGSISQPVEAGDNGTDKPTEIQTSSPTKAIDCHITLVESKDSNGDCNKENCGNIDQDKPNSQLSINGKV